MEIAGKVVLITGASEGIGAQCAHTFRQRGAKLALLARSAEKLRRVAGEDLFVAGDVTREDDCRRVVDATLSKYGRIDILINNAGVGLVLPSWQAPLDEVRAMYDVNFFAALRMTQLVVPGMRNNRAGCVVNVGSIAGKVTLPWLTLYSTTKYALGSLTDGLRMELRRDGIHTMTVCPGYVRTGFSDHLVAGRLPQKLREVRRFAISVEQCAEAIARGVERNARTVVTPAVGWLFIILERLLPSLVDRQLERLYWRGVHS